MKQWHRREWLGLLLVAVILPVSAGSYEEFFFAVRNNNGSKVSDLLQRGFDPNSVDPERGETGLMIALRSDSTRVVEVLLKAPNVDLEMRARNGDTALMTAAYKADIAAVQALLDHKAEVNRPGWTALHYAAAVGANDIVQLLLDRYAYIDAESPNKTTPIMMAARSGHILTVKLLLDEGADVTLKNDAGMTAIDLARKFEHADIAEGLDWRIKRAAKR
ncbi:ankyrin repeat domain-containing protein [Actimicrobium sp. CCI2.3]|uniref:ankyrin repeat domain-containing protein n=1 Tax=Actimicrobium sp. CCI2.3 TaxID=3048616 RepID=UPI002AB414A6|nr:ankyrin repeat domain-containing protein [Actimicrobium sp. CCI2.3]MDY7572904.1 ankyrin repeat domain-containing protein [Actimicrobium sp. CCI2.3]MEB0020749.1 ankyrin repeat domain-containing protein [Actimicrobium sp. CCI2.3]